MKKVKRLMCFLVLGIGYIELFDLALNIVPQTVNFVLSFFNISQFQHTMLASLIVVIIFFVCSSDKVYGFFHKRYIYWLKSAKKDFVKGLMSMLISFNDVLAAFPKRTFLFCAYLFYSILDKLGYMDTGVDVIFVGVFIIGVDRIAKSWKEEKKKLFALGKKAYSQHDRITDSIVRDATRD